MRNTFSSSASSPFSFHSLTATSSAGFLTHNASPRAPSFRDVPSSNPYAESITEATEVGIITGYADGTFRASNLVNRAELVKIAMLASQVSQGNCAAAPFADVPAGSWMEATVCQARQAGIVSGYPDGRFRPEQPVKLSEAAVILAKSFHLNTAARAAGQEWYVPSLNALLNLQAVPSTVKAVDQPLTRGETAAMTMQLWVDAQIPSSLQSLLLPLSSH